MVKADQYQPPFFPLIPPPFPPSSFLKFRGDPCLSATKTKFVLVPYEDVIESAKM